MLNALSRAAIGALKASKSNLTPKIVQNELPKAMVATTSTCEYDVPFSLILLARFLEKLLPCLFFRFGTGNVLFKFFCWWVNAIDRGRFGFWCVHRSVPRMASPAAAVALIVLGLYLSAILICSRYWLKTVKCLVKGLHIFHVKIPFQ